MQIMPNKSLNLFPLLVLIILFMAFVVFTFSSYEDKTNIITSSFSKKTFYPVFEFNFILVMGFIVSLGILYFYKIRLSN